MRFLSLAAILAASACTDYDVQVIDVSDPDVPTIPEVVGTAGYELEIGDPTTSPPVITHDPSLEICDGIDNDGDGMVDEEDTDPDTWCSLMFACYYPTPDSALPVVVFKGETPFRLISPGLAGEMTSVRLEWAGGSGVWPWPGNGDVLALFFGISSSINVIGIDDSGNAAALDPYAVYTPVDYWGYDNPCTVDRIAEFPFVTPP